MAILVIGGNGFIGRKLVKCLLQDKKVSSVVSMDITLPKEGFVRSIAEYSSRFHFVRGDISVLEDTLTAIKKYSIEQIVNLAYLMVLESEEMPRDVAKVNVLGMSNAFEAARLLGVPRVIYNSSNAVYGPQSTYGDKEVTEDDLLNPSSVYGITKQLNERMAAKYSELYGTRIIGLRPAFGFGHGREAAVVSDYFSGIVSLPAIGKPMFIDVEGSSGFTLICNDDIVNLTKILLEAPSPKYDMYNLAGPYTSLEQVAKQVRQYIPEARIEFGHKAGLKGVKTISMARSREEFGFSLTPLKDAVLIHINDAREEAGLEPLRV